jgi:glutaminyl-tRNA synthetase
MKKMDLNINESKDFIREIIDKDIKTNKYKGRVHTRFPPEPNGYLHIGHAKSICLNFGIAEEYKGLCNLRFDDTNPTKEEEEYVKSIIEDVHWLGFDWEDRLFYASNYFDEMYNLAVKLVDKGKAYVDDQNAFEISQTRGTHVKPGINSPSRDRSVKENLDLLIKMKNGDFKDGEKVLRAKIDMSHPNLNMRDPIIYRILHQSHHNTADKWCIYPMYDWAHGLEDSIEKITHSICTLEFENHRPLYDWFIDELEVYHPQQIEFARLNLNYTVMSKRKLKTLVDEGLVNGWDDPRLPTISGMRRRGYSPESIKDFCKKIGVAKVNSLVDLSLLEFCVRNDLNKTCNRYIGVINPLKVVIENFEENKIEEFDAIINPEKPELGKRKIPFSKTLYIEKDDFMLDPPKKFYRLTTGREVRFRYSYLITCQEAITKNDEIIELRCTIDPQTKGGYAPDGRRVKSTIHWISENNAIDAEIRLYDRLFTVKNPTSQKDKDFKEFINENSLIVVKNCKVDPSLKKLKPLDRFQFERLGYFCIDKDTTNEKLVINRTVTLKDTWAKIQKQQQKIK